jgi:hypothetical protein
MPLRDHFRPPLDDLRHWEGFHATWPVMMVASLEDRLPNGYFAEPTVRLDSTFVSKASNAMSSQPVYEVLIYGPTGQFRLVAAIEIVSPGNKDRATHRTALVGKCAAMLRERVSVVMVDVVTVHHPSLYAELLELLGHSDAVPSSDHSLYAAACRATNRRDKNWRLELWAHPLSLGQPLPTLPLWLADNLAVPLELEESYEQSCSILGIP